MEYLERLYTNSFIRRPEPGELSIERPDLNEPDYREKWTRYCEAYRKWLTEQGWTGEARWDFVGVSMGDKRDAFVIEVKTTRPRSRRQRSISALKDKLPADPNKAKKAGFKVLLIVVHLLDSWKFEIIEERL
jgi:hypothetical protein